MITVSYYTKLNYVLTLFVCLAVLLDAADVDTQFVLVIGVLNELRLHAEPEQHLQVASQQLHLVQNFGTDLHLLVSLGSGTRFRISAENMVNFSRL